MAITFDNTTKTYKVSYCKRHPITKKPIGLTRRNISTNAEAKRVLAELIIQTEDSIRKKILPCWNELVEKYFNSRLENGISAYTVYNEKSTVNKFTSEPWGNLLIDQITRTEIFQIINTQLKNKKDAHRAYFLKIVRGIFQFANDTGLIDKNPTPLLKFKKRDKIQSVLNESEVNHLLEKAKEYEVDWYYHWALALYSGMRNGELYALEWSSVDFVNRRIKVCKSWNRISGFKETKTGRDRFVDIAPGLLPVLEDLYATRIDNFVLPRMKSWDKAEQARELRTFLAGLGLPRVRFHDLRASWCTLLLSKGVEPVKVMKLGGWRDLKTLQIYMRLAGIDTKGAVDCLNLHDHSRNNLNNVVSIR